MYEFLAGCALSEPVMKVVRSKAQRAVQILWCASIVWDKKQVHWTAAPLQDLFCLGRKEYLSLRGGVYQVRKILP